MVKYLKIIDFIDITPYGLTGHKYRLKFEIGDVQDDVFISNKPYHAEIEISDIVEIVWKLDEEKTKNAVGSICLSNVLELAKDDKLELLQPIILNTFTTGNKPPKDLYLVTAGSIIPFPEKVKDQAIIIGKTEISFLSDNISEIRDRINTFAKNILGSRLLLIKQERALFDIYKSPKSDDQFNSRLSSLAGLIKSVNVKLIRDKLNIPNKDRKGWRQLIEELLSLYSDEETAKKISIVFKKIDDLRQRYPTHGDNLDDVLPAYDFFNFNYPIENYESAWETILNSYFNAMTGIVEIFKKYRSNKIQTE